MSLLACVCALGGNYEDNGRRAVCIPLDINFKQRSPHPRCHRTLAVRSTLVLEEGDKRWPAPPPPAPATPPQAAAPKTLALTAAEAELLAVAKRASDEEVSVRCCSQAQYLSRGR